MSGAHHTLDSLVDNPVRANSLGNLIFGASFGNEFLLCGHVDSIDAGKAKRGGVRCKIDFFGTRLPGGFYDCLRGISADD